MPDVFPRRNLPDDAEPWGRAHDDRVLALESGVEILNQSVLGQNRNSASSLAVIAAQVQKIADQQTLLISQQATLAAQQATLSAQQATLTATTNFLTTQTLSDARSSSQTFSGSNSGVTWRAFDATYDCALAVTTGAAGKLLIQASANLTGGGLSALIGIQVDGAFGPDYPGPNSTYVTDGSAGVTRVVVANLTPNTAYTVRMRRGIDGTASGVIIWRDQTLVVTRS